MAEGKVTIQIDMDGRKAQSEVKSLKSTLLSLGDDANKIGGSFKSLLAANVVGSALTTGIGAVTSNIQSLSREAMSASDGLQKFESTMSFGGYDGATIKQARADVKSYADRTVYDINDVANTTAQLASNGIRNYTELTQAAGNLNAVAGGNANTFKTVGMVMTQTAGAGKLTTENWNQLADAIPGASGKLQEEMLKNGAYTGNFREAMEKGEITAEEFNQAITDLGMTDVAKEAATSTATFEGAIGNLRATIVSGLLNVVDKAKPKLIELINSVTSFAGKIGDALGNLDIEGIISKVGSTISNVVSKVQTFWAAFSNTGAVSAFGAAIQSIAWALGHLWDSLTTSSSLETLASVLGNVVKWLSQAATVAAKFISSLPNGAIQDIVGSLVGLVAGFKAFNFIKSFNPFKMFKKNAKDGADGATEAVGQSKSKIAQILQGLASVIKSAGTSIAVAAKGIGTGLANAFVGLGTALKMAGPANIIALGTAVGIAAVGIGAGVGIIVSALTLLATQSAGVSVIIQALGTAFATVATAIIGAFAQAIVTVSGVLPAVTSALANLAPLVVAVGVAIGATAPAITALGDAFTSILGTLPPIITALGSAISQIATAITPIVGIISSAFVQIVTVVSNAIVQIVQALAPFIPAITQMVVAVAPVLQSIVDAFNNLISQISPIIDSIANLFKTLGEQISNILDSAKGVITGFGDAVRNVLDGISGIFDSMGNAALNAGKGVKEMAQGIKILVDMKLGDLTFTLGAVATGLGDMASHASGMSTLGTAMTQVGTGMALFATSSVLALMSLTMFGTAVTTLQTNLAQLPMAMTTAGAGFQIFATQAVSGVAGLSAVNAPIAAFKAQIMTLTPAIMSATVGFTMFGARAMVINSTFIVIGGLIGTFNARILSMGAATAMAGASFGALAGSVGALGGILSSVSGGFANIGASASSSAAQMRSIISAIQSVVSAFSSMRGQVQSSMQGTLSAVVATGNQMMTQGRMIGQQTGMNIAGGITSGAGSARAAMSSLMASVCAAGMAGVGSMRSIGYYIGQGLASGMTSSLGAVTAAANALVAQAERAARAKAKIHSPSRLFRDNVGRYIAQGVAVGIENDSYTVNDALGAMYDKVQAFSYRAEDLIGAGSTNFSHSIQVKSDLDKAIKAKVEIVQEKSNEVMEKAIDAMGRLADRPIDMRLNDDTLIASTSDRYQDYQQTQITRNNRMWGRP